jgi:hypothetical protein
MRCHTIIGLIALSVPSIIPASRADVVLSVTQDPSSTADLAALQVGDSITFDVTLSGLDVAGNQALGTIGATLNFDPVTFGIPASITPGTIIPDTTGFLTAPAAGVADASYTSVLANTSAEISSNGLFFEFTLVVQASGAGAGVVGFSFVDALDPNFGPVNISSGPDLAYRVNAVPEPSSLSLIVLAGAWICGPWIQARRRLSWTAGRDR